MVIYNPSQPVPRPVRRGGSFTQSTVGGVNLSTGMPLGGGGGGGPRIYNPGSMDSRFYYPPSSGGGGGGASPVSMGGSYTRTLPTSGVGSVMPGQVRSVQSNNPAGAASGGGIDPKILQNLLAQFQTDSTQARNDSLAQYDSLLKSVDATEGRVNSYLGNLGSSGRTRIDRDAQNAYGKTQQSIVSRGLGNTTIADDLNRGVARDAEDARQSLDDRIASQQIQTQQQLGNARGDAILSRANIQPDLSQFLGLIQALGGLTKGK